jgi:uncharacterized protein (DUF924 family)
MIEEVLKFWFEEIDPAQWFASDPAFDAEIRQRFLRLLQDTAEGEQYAWRASARGRLAEIIVLDQLSRNVHRSTPQAFAQDPMALVLAQEAVAAGLHRGLVPVERAFLLMPYMHSESRLIHVQAEALFREFAPLENYKAELRHRVIIERFGRYPHRNEVLGRTSSVEELEFLSQPGSSF